MVDPFLFLVPYKFLVDNYTHLGIIGKGRDTLFDTQCTVNVFQEKAGEKKFAMQIYHNIQTDLFQKKLDKLAMFMTQNCSPYTLKPLLLSFKNYDDKSFELIVLYEGEGVEFDKSLDEEIKEKKASNTPFGEAEMLPLLTVLIKAALLSANKSLEVHSLSPKNIFKGSEYVVSNFGLESPKKFEKLFHCPSDAYFNSKLNLVSANMLVRNLIFQAGMLLLYMGTLQDPMDLYSDLFNSDQKVINQDMLHKRIEQFKSSAGEKISSILEGMLQVKEEKRITADEILQKLEDPEIWYDEKVEGGYFRGFAKQGETIEPVLGCLAKDTGEIYAGKVGTELSKDGKGVYYDSGVVTYGNFSGDNITEGWLFKKNQFAFQGGINNFEIQDGEGLYIPLLSKRNPNCLYFKGKVSNSVPQSGEMVFLDGTRGDPANMEKSEKVVSEQENNENKEETQ